MDIAALLTTVSAAIGFARELNNVDVQLDQATLKLKVAELTSALADAKLGLVDVAEQMRAKDTQIGELKNSLVYKAEQVIERGAYRYKSVKGHPVGLPLCPICEGRGLFINMVQHRGNGQGISYHCPACKAQFGSHVSSYSLPAGVVSEVAE